MKRNAKTEKHKAFLRKMRERDANSEAQWKLGYKPLEKPIHHGYDAYWVLRDDVARRQDADKFQQILDNFGTTVWCRNKDFRVWDRYYKRMVDVNPGLREIDQKRYDNLSQWEQKFFYSYQKQSSWGGATRTVYAVNIPSHFLVRKVVKSYKTHYKVLDSELQREEAEIKAQLETTFYDEREKYWYNRGSSKNWRKIFTKKDRAHNKVALRKNMGTIYALSDDISDDWASWLDGWCDDFYEFKYNHRHYGRWYFD